MDKTFDVLNDKALAVFDDRLPVVFKYNGETLRKLSALTKNVNNSETNVNEVSYTSEYNRSLRNLGVSGNTTQKSYGGYQLLNFKDFTKSTTDSDGSVITYVVKDGIATVNGKINKTAVVAFNDTELVDKSIVFKAGTYTLTPHYYREQGQSIGSCDWMFRYVDTGTRQYVYSSSTGLATFTFDSDFQLVHAQPYIWANKEYTNFKYCPALIKGTYTSLDQLPPYEPYVGGIPSPNPGQKIPIYTPTEETVDLTSDLESASITYDSNSLYTIAFEHPFSFNGAESLTLKAGYFNTGNPHDVLLVGADTSNILNGYGTLDYIAKGDASQSEVTIYSSGYGDTFYIGFGNIDTGLSVDDVESYRSLAIGAGVSASGIVQVQTGVQEIPAYPQEIVNVNNEGMSVVVRSPSLLPMKDNSGSKTDSDGNVLSWEIKDGIVTLNGKSNTFTTITLTASNAFGWKTLKAGTYTFTPYYYKEQGQPMISCDWQFHILDLGKNVNSYTDPSKGLATKAIEGDFYVNACHLYIYANVEFVNYKYAPALFEGTYASLDDLPPFQPHFREEIAIPSSVEVNGDTVPLLFTKWDKLTVDRISNKVTYTEGSWQRAITGKENWFESWGAISSGYGKFYCLKITPYRNGTLRDNEGYSTHFKRSRWVESAPKNSFLASHSDGDLILFCTDKTTKVADIKIWLQEKYAEGNPVVFLVRRYTYLEHDITNTDFGNLILDLTNKIPYGTIYLQIGSGLSVPITVDYAKWGGANE